MEVSAQRMSEVMFYQKAKFTIRAFYLESGEKENKECLHGRPLEGMKQGVNFLDLI